MTYDCLQKIHQPLEQLFHFSALPVPVSHHGWSPKCLPKYTPPFGTFISLSYLLLWSSVSVAFFLQSPVQGADPSDSVTTEEWALLIINLCFPSRPCSWHQHEQLLIWLQMPKEAAMASYQYYHFWNSFAVIQWRVFCDLPGFFLTSKGSKVQGQKFYLYQCSKQHKVWRYWSQAAR